MDCDKSVMHPIMREAVLASAERLGLRNLILMMRENQVASAAMKIECASEIFKRHSRALDVPARTSVAPWAFPERLTRLCGLPDSKIHRILFALIHLNTRPGHHIVK